MIGKLKGLFSRRPQQQKPGLPNTPLEILVPEGQIPPEPPKMAEKLLSFLVASPHDVNTIELQGHGGHIHSTDSELRQFLFLIAGANQINMLVYHCNSIMYKSTKGKSIGTLGCVQQGWLYSFAVYEHSSLPDLKWEFCRSIREIQETKA